MWSTSDRRQRLPRNWSALRRRVLARDKWCRKCGLNLSAEVDHIQPGDNHALDNLAGVCTPCHRRKSSTEGGQASARSRAAMAALRKRPPEPHPGGW